MLFEGNRPVDTAPNDPIRQARNEAFRTLSLVVLSIVLLALTAMAIFLPLVASQFLKIFTEMGRELPALTQWVVGTPAVLHLAFAGLFAAALIAKEFLLPPKAALWLNGLAILLLLGAVAVYVVAVFQPMIDMLAAMQGN